MCPLRAICCLSSSTHLLKRRVYGFVGWTFCLHITPYKQMQRSLWKGGGAAACPYLQWVPFELGQYFPNAVLERDGERVTFSAFPMVKSLKRRASSHTHTHSPCVISPFSTVSVMLSACLADSSAVHVAVATGVHERGALRWDDSKGGGEGGGLETRQCECAWKHLCILVEGFDSCKPGPYTQ